MHKPMHRSNLGLIGLDLVVMIVLVLLVILFIIYSLLKTSSEFSESMSCESVNGFCAQACSSNYATMDAYCPKLLPKCCVRVGEAPKAEIIFY